MAGVGLCVSQATSQVIGSAAEVRLPWRSGVLTATLRMCRCRMRVVLICRRSPLSDRRPHWVENLL